jgi:hypothetical protein
MSPATATPATRPASTPAPPAGGRADDRVIEIDLGEPARRNDPRPAFTAARLEELARLIRLR